MKIKKTLTINKKIDILVWRELEHLQNDLLKEINYNDLKLLADRVITKTSVEINRDYKIIDKETHKIYVKNIHTKEIYEIEYLYAATFKSDDYEINNIQISSEEEIQRLRIIDDKGAILKTFEKQDMNMFDMFVGSTSKDDKYETTTYSYYISYLDEEDEDF